MFFKRDSGKVSNTVVVNILVLALGLLEVLKVSPAIPPAWVGYILLAIGIINVVLRVFFTKEPILG